MESEQFDASGRRDGPVSKALDTRHIAWMTLAMRQLGLVLLSASAVAGLGCQKDQSAIEKKLDDIDKRLAGIEKAIQEGARAGAARPRARRPPGPDPSKAYAVPIEGAPFKGAEHAKVTIVEAFEFA